MSLFLSLSLLHLFSFFFIYVAMAAVGSNTSYPTCPSYDNCGNVTIKYPFWRKDVQISTQTQSQYCGYQGFEIICRENRSTIELEKELYYVRNISYESGVINLVDDDVFENTCPRVRHEIKWPGSLFNFSADNVKLSFHFNCSGALPPFASEIGCMGQGTGNKSCVSYEAETKDWVWACEDEVVTWVLRGRRPVEARRLGSEYEGELRKGFELRWGTVGGCGKCEDSHGRCGYNWNTEESMCFCSDGRTTTGDCRKGSKINWKLKLLIGFLSSGFGVLLMCVIFYFYRRRSKKKQYSYGSSYRSRNISSYTSSVTDPEKNGTYHGVQIFKYRELEKATNHFDSANELGDGGFGTVYQGKLRDGRVVAVKRLYENNYKRVEQFMNEVGILAHLRHQNLVSLYGCTTHHSRELLLVYEYIPNGTVADHLHGEKSNPGSLSWTTRMCIAIETASALVYLHASDVVHRDVKTNNILLDNSFTVKVADFGLSRLFPTNVTHVSTAPQGTPGYVDPEYHECYQLTSKSDVYSFGVVLMELISSKPAVDITRHRHEINLSNMALNKIRNDALHELVDPNLGFERDYEVRKMIHAVAELAFQCLQSERDCRPSMDEVLEGLKGIQNGRYKKEKQDVLDGSCDDAVLLKDHSEGMSPDSVAIAWSTSTMSTSSG